jgi:hypothetical protein
VDNEALARGFGRVGGIAGVGVWMPSGEMVVEVASARAEVYTAAEEACWASLCAANGRVHDGEILRVVGVDFERSVVRCERGRYKRLVVSRALGASEEVRILGVKGFIVGRDAAGGEHVLIGRRGAQTRVYGGLWETAPAGGVAVPRDGVTAIGVRELAASVEEEGEEELGVALDTRGARVVAVCRDEVAGSDDVFLRFEMAGVINPRRAGACQHGSGGWEYSDTAWLARADAAGFDSRGLIAPVRAVLRVLGWVSA